MEYQERYDLADKMAVKVYLVDMTNVMVPTSEAMNRLPAARRSGDYNNLVARMLDALIALEDLGYRIEPPPSPN